MPRPDNTLQPFIVWLHTAYPDLLALLEMSGFAPDVIDRAGGRALEVAVEWLMNGWTDRIADRWAWLCRVALTKACQLANGLPD